MIAIGFTGTRPASAAYCTSCMCDLWPVGCVAVSCAACACAVVPGSPMLLAGLGGSACFGRYRAWTRNGRPRILFLACCLGAASCQPVCRQSHVCRRALLCAWCLPVWLGPDISCPLLGTCPGKVGCAAVWVAECLGASPWPVWPEFSLFLCLCWCAGTALAGHMLLQYRTVPSAHTVTCRCCLQTAPSAPAQFAVVVNQCIEKHPCPHLIRGRSGRLLMQAARRLLVSCNGVSAQWGVMGCQRTEDQGADWPHSLPACFVSSVGGPEWPAALPCLGSV